MLGRDGIKYRCEFAGRIGENNRDGVPKSYIGYAANKDIIAYVGMIKEIRELILLSNIIVLSTYYREGVPRILMKPAAMGKPLIATNVAGYREVIENRMNELLVRPKDCKSLKKAINTLISVGTKRIEYGKSSLAISKTRFDQKVINERTADLYNEYGTTKLLKQYSWPSVYKQNQHSIACFI